MRTPRSVRREGCPFPLTQIPYSTHVLGDTAPAHDVGSTCPIERLPCHLTSGSAAHIARSLSCGPRASRPALPVYQNHISTSDDRMRENKSAYNRVERTAGEE